MWRRVYVVNARTRNLEPWRTDSTEICAVLSEVFNCQSKCGVSVVPREHLLSKNAIRRGRGRYYSISFSFSLLSLFLPLPVILHVRTLFFTVHPERILSGVYNPTRPYQKIQTIVTNNKNCRVKARRY